MPCPSRRRRGFQRISMTASVVVVVAVVVLAASLPTRASSSSSSSSGGDGGHLTLGDLESSTTTIMRSDDGESGPISIDTPPLVVGRGAMFGSGCRPNANAEEEEPVSPDANANASRPRTTTKSPRRAIKLDLSGRVMCHVVGSRNCNNNGGHRGRDDDDDDARSRREHHSVGESTVPLISIEQKSERRAIIPRNVYLGADYDLDEVWYGATRWIGRCSWGPFATSSSSSSSSSSPKATTTTSGNDGSPASFSNRVVHSAERFYRTLLPSSSSSSWIVDAEGEKSVFDRSDSTVRLRLIQSPGRRRRNHPPTADSARRISVEYDSAKYDDDDDTAARGGAERHRRIRYAPSVVVDFTTPMFHPRLEARSRHTWVVRSGGDRYGNYYGGDHYGDSRCSPVDRRMDRIRTRMRDGVVPRSNPVVEAGRRSAATTTTTNGGGVENFRNRLSRWLENDGWMPRRATVDLMGNLVSVNEVGFGHSRGKASGGGLLKDDGDDERTENSGRRPSSTSSSRGIFPHVRDAGIRLRVSKRVDWTSVGIFPWSKNNDAAASSGKKHRSGDDGFLVDALRSAHVRLDLCGAYGPEEDRCAAMSVGVDVDPLDWRRTLKVIVGREGVGVLGRG